MYSFDRLHYSIRGSYLVWDKKQKALREEYLAEFRAQFRATLEAAVIEAYKVALENAPDEATADVADEI